MTKQLDLIVVGAGPCGIAVGAAAEQAGLSCMLIELPLLHDLLQYSRNARSRRRAIRDSKCETYTA